MILIFLNCSGILLILLTALSKPFVVVGKMIFAKHHSHDGSLRGMHVTETKEKNGFIGHFLKVALSNEKEGRRLEIIPQTSEEMDRLLCLFQR